MINGLFVCLLKLKKFNGIYWNLAQQVLMDDSTRATQTTLHIMLVILSHQLQQIHHYIVLTILSCFTIRKT